MNCFLYKEKLTVKYVKEKFIICRKNTSDCFIIYTKDVTTSAKNSLDTIEFYGNIEIWSIKELQYNITLHSLVPRHEKVTDEQELTEMKSLKLLIF